MRLGVLILLAAVVVGAAEMPTGVGVVMVDRKGDGEPLRITRVFAGTGAEMAGLRGNCFLVSIDGRNVVGMALTNAVRALRGPAGRVVVVGVADGERRQTNVFRIVRGVIRAPEGE